MGLESQKDTLLAMKGFEFNFETYDLSRLDLRFETLKLLRFALQVVFEHALLFVLLSNVSWLSISCISFSVFMHCLSR
jgi:hypothetical protein